MLKVKVTLENGNEVEVDMSQESIQSLLDATKEKSIYSLEYNDKFYSISFDGEVTEFRWGNDSIDKRLLEVGNVFLTREGVEKELRIREFLAKWKREYHERGWTPDWDDHKESKCYVVYDHDDKELCVYSSCFIQCYSVFMYFKTEKQAKQFIKENEEDLKLWLGVE